MPVRPLQKKTESERIEEFIAQLKERTDLSDEALEAIGDAKNFNTAQYLAITEWDLPEKDLPNIVFAMKGPFFDESLVPITQTNFWRSREATIGPKPMDAIYTDTEGQPLNISPDEDGEGGYVEGVDMPNQSFFEESGITPEQWAELTPENRQGLLDAWESTRVDDEDTRNYLGLFQQDPRTYTDIISAPGYSFTYGEGLTAPSTQYMRNQTAANPTMYVSGDEVAKWSGYSPSVRQAFTEKMVTAGMISEEDAASLDYSGSSRVQIEAFREALATANYLGTTPAAAIFARGETMKANPPPGGGGRPAFSIPAQFRTIPDYETLQQRTKEMMRRAMGRDAEDWEMNLLADELKVQHKAYNEKMIQASREAYNRGQHTVDIEVPDPTDRTQKFFEETYAGELGRRRDIGEASATNMLMMNALTMGGGMVE